MNLCLKALTLSGSLLAAGLAAAQTTPPTALLILAKRDQTLAIVDPVSLKVVARVPVGADPHEVIASADGKIAYVSDYGGGSLHTLSVVDLVALSARWVVPTA
jgi:DNA-binding beta-propeller fold protein YncE